MNSVFIFLVICGAVAVWFLLYKLFQPLGKLLNHIGRKQKQLRLKLKPKQKPIEKLQNHLLLN